MYTYSCLISLFAGVTLYDKRFGGKDVLHILTEANDVKMVAPLTLFLEVSDRDMRLDVENALANLLPQIGPDASELIPLESMEILLKELSKKSSHLATPVLKALCNIGNENALPLVERLSKKSDDHAVKQAALECLPSLRQRVEDIRSASMLLRPASAPELLLRPAPTGGIIDPDKLLRPAADNEANQTL